MRVGHSCRAPGEGTIGFFLKSIVPCSADEPFTDGDQAARPTTVSVNPQVISDVPANWIIKKRWSGVLAKIFSKS
jgi:hypothetical protein